MRAPRVGQQAGYALILTVLGLMSIGGFVLAGFTQQVKLEVDQQRFLRNQRVLEEAKQALLMYAYNYPTNNPGRRPGRMPCPDVDNDGLPDPSFDCTDGVPLVGRFPWADPEMNFYDIRDASGERLWYAVSRNFANQPNADIINSDTTGTITVHDQGGTMIYDNSLAGIAAVIIAPGAVVDRLGVAQNRSIANGDNKHDATADTDPGIVGITNYLDVSGGHDNADFINTASANGFILGPIFAAGGDVVVNDQMVLITAEEVTAMAARAVLQTYREKIDEYQQNIWGATAANYRYPWLNDYDDVTDLEVYHVVPGAGADTAGRVPYLHYYQDHDSHTVVTDLVIDYDIDFNLTDTGSDGGAYLDAFDDAFGAQQLDLQDANLSFIKQRFDDTANNTSDNLGTMIVADDGVNTAINGGAAVTRTLYFWDGCASSCDMPSSGWQLCDGSATSPQDCAKSGVSPFNFEAFTSWSNHADIRIRYVRLRLNLDAEFELGVNYAAVVAGAITPPDGATSARRLTNVLPGLQDLVVDEAAAADADIEFMNIVVEACEQDNYVVNSFDLPPAGSTFDCTASRSLSAAPVVVQFDVNADYYPELPLWVRKNRWNDSVMLAYADDYKPGGDNDCMGSTSCLTLRNNFDGQSDDNISLLIAAGSMPANSADLENIFELENNAPDEDRNAALNAIYDANPVNGDDSILLIDEN